MDHLQQFESVSIVIPTRNESANIRPLVERVDAAMALLGPTWEVLFVDDSDDCTPAAIEDAGLRYPVRLCHRPPGERDGGLSGAVTLGFGVATGDVLVVMDGDLQHPPEIVPSLVGAVRSGAAEICVATRYRGSGSARGLSGPIRQAVSDGSRAVTHTVIARSRGVSDPLSGFFALRRSVIAGIELRANGFKILLEILARGCWSTVEEVPFVFAERVCGKSKANAAEGLRFVCHVMGLARTRRPCAPEPQRRSQAGSLK
jgi:glycosyltransferase involved in cell wall biosynthesis